MAKMSSAIYVIRAGSMGTTFESYIYLIIIIEDKSPMGGAIQVGEDKIQKLAELP